MTESNATILTERAVTPETNPTNPRRGEVFIANGVDHVLIGYDTQTGNAYLATMARGRVVFSTTTKEQVLLLERRPTPEFPISTWVEKFNRRGDKIIPESIPPEIKSESVDAREARDMLVYAERKGNIPPPNLCFKGDLIDYEDGLYTLVAFSEKTGGNTVYLARKNPTSRTLESKEVPLSGISPIREHRLKGQEIKYAPLPFTRYTRELGGQEARLQIEMGRPYYRAGEKIDGSVIQNWIGEEILVVDFSKDKWLLDFYNDTLNRYRYTEKGAADISGLPEFFYDSVLREISYNFYLTDGLLDGTTQKVARENPDFLLSLPAGINREDINKIVALPPLYDQKIEVGTYLRLGFGVCRQQGVVLAACIEKAIKDLKPAGLKAVEIRNNHGVSIEESLFGGHLWVQILETNSREKVFDVANRYVGPPDRGPWNYRKGYENHIFGKPGT